MEHQKSIVEESQAIFEAVREQYEYVRKNPETPYPVLMDAKRKEVLAFSHLLDTRYWARKGMLK